MEVNFGGKSYINLESFVIEKKAFVIYTIYIYMLTIQRKYFAQLPHQRLMANIYVNLTQSFFLNTD